MPHEIIIQTDRLLLRPFVLEDAEEMYALNADPAVMQYVPDPPFEEVAAARQFLAAYLPLYATGFGRLALIRQSDDVFLGWCGIKDRGEGVGDIGFRLHRRFWGQGYATEAALFCLEDAKQRLGLGRVIGHAATENWASRRVLEKIGLQEVGTFTEPDWAGVAYAMDF